MEGVIEQGWFFLVCDSDHLTLVGVKRYQTFTLPGFKFLGDLTEGPDNLPGLKR